jgi:hypothetical protein
MDGADSEPRDLYLRRLESRRADLAASEQRLRLHSHLQAATLLSAVFADRMEFGRIYFDYKMAQGVVQGSNAIELMRSVGLNV